MNNNPNTQLPQELKEEIKQKATAYMHSEIKGMVGDTDELQPSSLKYAYEEGATAYATKTSQVETHNALLKTEIKHLNSVIEGLKAQPGPFLIPGAPTATGTYFAVIRHHVSEDDVMCVLHYRAHIGDYYAVGHSVNRQVKAEEVIGYIPKEAGHQDLQELAISLRLKGDRLVSLLQGSNIEGAEEAINDWLEKKEPATEKEGLEWLHNDHIEFCYRHPDGRVEIRYRRIEGTPECEELIKEVDTLIEKAKPEVSPYFYRKEAKAKEQVVIRNNSNAFRHWVANVKGYPIALLGHCTGIWLPDGVTPKIFESEWEAYEKANNPFRKEVKP